MSKPLGRNEWVVAALKALATHGVDAVRVEKLAQSFKVTKGSFYWHFKNRDALLKAVLQAWQKRATRDVISQVEVGKGDARSRLRALFEIVLSSDGRLEMQVRAWGSRDPKVRNTVSRIDKARISYCTNLLREHGLTRKQAEVRALFAYHAMIGQFTVGPNPRLTSSNSRDLALILEMLLEKPTS